MENKKVLSGIGGWLLLLIISMSLSLVFEPLIFLSSIYMQEQANPRLLDIAQWQSYKLILKSLFLLVFILKLIMIYGLIKYREPEVVPRTKKLMWITGPIATSIIFLASTVTLDSWAIDVPSISTLIASVVVTLVWVSYLSKSVRVKNTYGLTNPIDTDETDNTIKAMVEPDEASDDKIYERIADELDGGNLNRATWTKVYAACDGDEKKTRAEYIKLRFKQLNESQNSTQEPPTIVTIEPPIEESEAEPSLSEQLVNDDYDVKSTGEGKILLLTVISLWLLVIIVSIVSAGVKSEKPSPSAYLEVAPTEVTSSERKQEGLTTATTEKPSGFKIDDVLSIDLSKSKAIAGDFSGSIDETKQAQSKNKSNSQNVSIKPFAEGSRESWLLLKRGMSRSQVINLLGEPDYELLELIWSYPNDGSVYFSKDRTTDWEKPTAFVKSKRQIAYSLRKKDTHYLENWSFLKKGMTKSDVLELIGKPYEVTEEGNKIIGEMWAYSYNKVVFFDGPSMLVRSFY